MRHKYQRNSPIRAVRNNAVGFRGRATSSGPRRFLGIGGGCVRRFLGQRRITNPTTTNADTIIHVAVICSCVTFFLLRFKQRRMSLPKTPSALLYLDLRYLSTSQSMDGVVVAGSGRGVLRQVRGARADEVSGRQVLTEQITCAQEAPFSFPQLRLGLRREGVSTRCHHPHRAWRNHPACPANAWEWPPLVSDAFLRLG